MAEAIRVILNDRVLFRPLTGVGQYTRQLIAAMADVAQVEIHGFLADVLRIPAPRESTAVGAFRPASAVRRGRGRGTRFKRWVRPLLERPYAAILRRKARGYELYHEPNHIPVPSDTPTVTTIHDLSVLLHPEWHPYDRVRWYERDFQTGQQQTRRFIAASQFTRDEMTQQLGVAADRIDVTYQAPRPGFAPREASEVRRVLHHLELADRFFLFVGTLEPRKNVLGLFGAFAGLPRTLRQRCPLVLAGGWGWRMEELEDTLGSMGLQDEVRFTGYTSDETLSCLYSACTAMVWPSLYEGFGLPPLEAMACGGPVIVSKAASLPEVVGDAGVLLDPLDVPSWTEAMRRMEEDDAWREQWRRLGPGRAATFTWRRCAEQTAACYRAALQSA